MSIDFTIFKRFKKMHRTLITLLLSLGMAAASFAQLLATNPDWKENEAPPPPAVNFKGLLPFEVYGVSNLTWALDPAALTIVGDGLVRYVVVARSQSGVFNALYEVINCTNGQLKTYARIIGKELEATGKAWVAVQDPQWKSMYDIPSRHALSLAKQGVCTGNTAAQTVSEIVTSLKKTTIVFKNKSAP
jgi:CNP1-like family